MKSRAEKGGLNELMNELARWAIFYLLMAGTAATLLGLMFVVITVAAERRVGDAAKIPFYPTPTVIYLASVLYLAALLTFPYHTLLTASVCTCLVGVAGLVYLTLVAAAMLSLLALAIRNSWAITVDVVSTPRGEQS